MVRVCPEEVEEVGAVSAVLATPNHSIYNNSPSLSGYSRLENSYYRTQLLRIALFYPSF
jgi:hypothetical protein